MVNYSLKEHLLYIKRKEKIFYPIHFTLFHITLHVISWCATNGPPCIITKDTANSPMAKRNYNDSYIKFGFTSLNDQGIEKWQCVVCYRVLSNESLRPSKLSNHLNTSHPELKDRNMEYMEYFKRLESNCKCQRLDGSGSFQQTDQKLTEPCFFGSQIIGRQKKPHNIGETVIKPSALGIARIVLGEKYEMRLQSIPLSDNTVKRRIALMSKDIKE